MTVNEAQPASGPSGARQTVTDRAVQAGERLLDASTKMGNAYADAYQEAVISMADFREKLGDAGAVDWATFAPQAGAAGMRAPGKPLRDAADTATRVNEQILAATKKMGLAYVDAFEEVVLGAVGLHEQSAAASENKLMRSAGSTHAGLAREVTRAYVEAARRLLS